MNDPAPLRRDKSTSAILLMGLVLGSFVSQIPIVIGIGTLVCALYVYASWAHFPVAFEKVATLMIICLLFLPAFLKPYHGLSPLFYFFSTVVTFFAAKSVSQSSPLVLLTAFRTLYVVSLGAIGVVLYLFWGNPEPFGMVIEGSSTNGIPAYLIVVQIGLSLCFYLVHRRLPLWPTVATAAVAFYGNGRGSLIVASFLICATLVLNLLPTAARQRGSQIRLFAMFLAAAVGLAFYGVELGDFLARHTKLSAGIMDTNRLEIWNDYAEKLGPFTLLFGADYAGTIIETQYNNNPHIAYIRTHAFFGLPLTMLAIVSPAIVLFSRKIFSAKLVFFTFIGLGALRAYTEPIFFPTLLDFFYFTYFWIFFNHAPESSSSYLSKVSKS